MKSILLFTLDSFLFLQATAQNPEGATDKPYPAKKIQVVDASCGQCKLGLPGKDCNLAVRINGKAYFVDGAGIDSYGDAHAKDGFCQAIRKAEVQGEVVDNRFKVTYFKLIKPAKEKE